MQYMYIKSLELRSFYMYYYYIWICKNVIFGNDLLLDTGEHCESCLDGYYGDPTNGGKCSGNVWTIQDICLTGITA